MKMTDILSRLRAASQNSPQRTAGDDIFEAAADEIENLRVENETLDVMAEVGFDGFINKGEEITRLKRALVDAREDAIRLHHEKMRYFEALLLIAADDKMQGVITDRQRTMWLIARYALNSS